MEEDKDDMADTATEVATVELEDCALTEELSDELSDELFDEMIEVFFDEAFLPLDDEHPQTHVSTKITISSNATVFFI